MMNYFNSLNLKLLAVLFIPFIFLFQVFINLTSTYADWQSTLEGQFDIVETFDELQDWTGSNWMQVIDKNDMPKKLDGSPSIWENYAYWNSNKDFSQKWIGNHGANNVFGTTGKSLRLDYRDFGNKGPMSIGFSIGNKPSDGYPKEVYVFNMNKYNKEFFPTNGNSFMWFNYLKTLEVSTGFRDIWNFGTVEEENLMPVNTTNPIQVHNVYGLNFHVMNFTVADFDGDKMKGQYNVHTSLPDGSNYQKDYSAVMAPNTNYSNPILNSQWFGIEYHFVKSDPGIANGLVEIWAYDQNGDVISHDTLNNIVTFRTFTNNGTEYLANHSFNKFVWGGNRYKYDFELRTDGYASTESHVYIDDIVVNGTRIGPKYFSLLNSGGDTTPPNPPTGLTVEP